MAPRPRQQAATDPTDAAAVQKVAAAKVLTQSLGRSRRCGSLSRPEGNQTMLQLQNELTDTENHVSLARQAYNES